MFFGDIFGRPGREAIAKILPKWKRRFAPDFIIANADNLAHGKSVTGRSLNDILNAGVDFLTSGNHIWEKKEAWKLLEDKNLPIIRPANYPPGLPGDGWRVVKVGRKKILIIALLGRIFMHVNPDDPFRKADEILTQYFIANNPEFSRPSAELANKSRIKREKMDAIIIDWHAEVSSEKQVLGWYLDGRVSAVLGTHTHIQTADERVLPGGTALISDVGFVGPRNSVIGIPPETSIELFTKQIPVPKEPAPGPVEVDAVLLEINDKTGLAKSIKRLQTVVEIKPLATRV